MPDVLVWERGLGTHAGKANDRALVVADDEGAFWIGGNRFEYAFFFFHRERDLVGVANQIVGLATGLLAVSYELCGVGYLCVSNGRSPSVAKRDGALHTLVPFPYHKL